MVFLSLSILIAIIFLPVIFPLRIKEVNIQSPLAVTHGTHKFEEPCLQSFEAADHERTGEHALGPFLESILLQKSSHSILVLLSHTLPKIYMRLIGLVYLILQSQSKHLTLS